MTGSCWGFLLIWRDVSNKLHTLSLHAARKGMRFLLSFQTWFQSVQTCLLCVNGECRQLNHTRSRAINHYAANKKQNFWENDRYENFAKKKRNL